MPNIQRTPNKETNKFYGSDSSISGKQDKQVSMAKWVNMRQPKKKRIVTDPDDVFKVSSAEIHKPKFLKKYSQKIIGNGLIFGSVPSWQNHRKQLNPSFNQQVLDGYMNVFNRQSRILMKDLECMFFDDLLYWLSFVSLVEFLLFFTVFDQN
ncbi:unnamed protein product, partial [Leptidea sinapis]